jgi:translation elongation factor EF-Tu-like GTPase
MTYRKGEITRAGPSIMTELPTCHLVATLRLLSTAEGGRQTPIRKDVYRPQFFLGLSSASCRVVEIDKGTLSPGEEGEVEMTLLHPERWGTELQPGANFEIREGLRVVGRGIIKDVRL